MLDSIRTIMISTDRPESGNAPLTLTDLARRFADPPREYSPVPIWWWSGERLDPARLRWQLEQFVAGGPPCYSEAWWQIFPQKKVDRSGTRQSALICVNLRINPG